MFAILKEEEATVLADSKSSPSAGGEVNVKSTFSSKVTGGQSYRSCDINTGDFYVELRAYHIQDVKQTPSNELYKKAMAAVKLRCQDGSPEWAAAQVFITKAFALFQNAKPRFYKNKD